MNCIKASRAEWKAKIADSRPAKFSRISEPLIHVEQPSFGGKTAVEALEYINSAFEFDEHPQQTSEETISESSSANTDDDSDDDAGSAADMSECFGTSKNKFGSGYDLDMKICASNMKKLAQRVNNEVSNLADNQELEFLKSSEPYTMQYSIDEHQYAQMKSSYEMKFNEKLDSSKLSVIHMK